MGPFNACPSLYPPSFLRILPSSFSEAQSWRKRNMTHQCSHERAPASAHASAHASVHESAHKSWLSLCYNPIQKLPLVDDECSRGCSRGFPRKCTRSGLVVCHLAQRKTKGWGETQGRGKHTIKPLPKNGFGPPPPLMIRFPPPPLFTQCHSP